MIYNIPKNDKCILYFFLLYIIIILSYKIYLIPQFNNFLSKINYKINFDDINKKINSIFDINQYIFENGNISLETIFIIIYVYYIGLKCPNYYYIVLFLLFSFELLILYVNKSSNIFFNPIIGTIFYTIGTIFSKKINKFQKKI
jgi:hypothetical protein